MPRDRLNPQLYRDFLLDPGDLSPLSLKNGRLVSRSLQSPLPVIGDIPLAVRHPRAFLADWKFKSAMLLSFFRTKSKRAASEGRGAGLLVSTAQRLALLRAAYEDNASVLAGMLEPLELVGVARQVQQAVFERIPKQLAALAYHKNVFRDWTWGQGEIETQVDLVTRHTRQSEKLLVLGAGTCRLPLRLHDALGAKKTLAVDMHAILFLITRHLMTHRTSALYEFPRLPRSAEFAAVRHDIQRVRRPENFLMLFADAQDLPVQRAYFDTVVTPWLIDVVPQNTRDFARTINSYLPLEGAWVNIGLLAYERNKLAEQLTPEEVREVLDSTGFRVDSIGFQDVPYLQSPYESIHRTDRILHFRAIKVRELEPPPRFSYLPEWLADWNCPAPKTPEIQELKAKSELYLQILQQIDGARSIAEVARELSKTRRMNRGQAEEIVVEFLTNVFENFIYREF